MYHAINIKAMNAFCMTNFTWRSNTRRFEIVVNDTNVVAVEMNVN